MNKKGTALWKDRLSYGFGGFGLNAQTIIISALLTYFYTNVMNMDIAKVGTIMLISRIFDGGTDVIMGIILGKTQTKWGKCRPWLLWTSIPFGLSIFLMFTVPNSTDLIKLIYVFVTYNLSNSIVGTATWLSYNTLLSLLTRDQLERGMISTIRQALCPLIEVFITGITIPICVHFGNTQRIWLIVIGIYSIIAAVCGMICFAGTTERVQVEAEVSAEHAGAPKISAWAQFKSVLSNKYWAMALALWLLLTFYNIINGTDLTYYCQYILGNANYVGMISVAERIPVVSATFLLPLVLKKFGKRNLSLFGAVVAILSHFIVVFCPTNVTMIMAAAVLRGIGFAPLCGVIFAMIADTVEYGQWKTHIRAEGIIFSAATVGLKVGAGIGTWAVTSFLGAAGFNGALAEQSASAMTAISNLYKFGPIIVWVVILLVLLAYHLDRDYDTIINDLSAREQNGAM